MDRDHRTTILTAVALLALLPVAASAQTTPDAEVTITADGRVTPESTHVMELAEAVPGERYAWNVTVEDERAILRLNVEGAFDVERPRQAVPKLDGRFFAHLPRPDVEVADPTVAVFNVTGDASAFTYTLTVPGPTNATLTLERDVEPPGYELGLPENVTHIGFTLRTTTTEFARADLMTRPFGSDGAPVRHPTPTPALKQNFPIIGLDANTVYEYWLRFWDFSGNAVETEPAVMRTEPAPVVPVPTVEIVSPPHNATVAPNDVTVEVRYESPDSTVTIDGVRLFFDKREVPPAELVVADGVVRYDPPAPLDPRRYSVSVEVTNEAGGTGEARWSFHVEGADAPGPSVAFVLLALTAALAAMGSGRRRSRP